jgi:ATP-dependent DNA ligase
LVPEAPGPSVPFPPQEAELVEEIPTGPKWQYEPKWDGFRGVLENDNGELALWSRIGRPLLR